MGDQGSVRGVLGGIGDGALTRRRVLKGGAAGLVAGGSIVAGGRPAAARRTASRQTPTQASGPITFAVWAGTVETGNWDPIIAAFNEEQPEVEVTVQEIPAESWAGFFDAVSTRIAGGQVPDLIRVATEGQRLFVDRDLVEPLDALIERDGAELQEFFDDVDPKLVEWNRTLSSTDGQTYYLPHGFNTVCCWYSAELFGQAGIKEPTDEWTWDDFLAAAEQLTDPGRVFGMHVPAAYFTGVMPWFLTNGASTLNADWSASTASAPAAVAAAEWMRSLVEREISPQPGGEFDPFGAMAQGRLAMFGAGRWPTNAMRELDYVDQVKLVAWPRRAGQGSPVGWDAHPIMKASPNKEAAWAFVKFLASTRAQEIEVGQGGPTVPPRRSVAQSEAFLGNAPAGMDKLYAAVAYATPIPSPTRGNLIEQDVIDAFNQILAGNVSAADGLRDLDAKITANL